MAEDICQNQDYQNNELVIKHCTHLKSLEKLRPNALQRVIRRQLENRSQGKLTPKMLDYFSIHPLRAFSFRKTAQQAEQMARGICNVNTRHVNDEVDAIRHFIWSTLMAYKLGGKAAFDITTLQEARENSTNTYVYMDLFNNELGITYARNFNGDKDKLKETALYLLNRGDFHVLESKESECQRPELYPNAHLF